jgi:hypothetical protein
VVLRAKDIERGVATQRVGALQADGQGGVAVKLVDAAAQFLDAEALGSRAARADE